MPPRRSPVAARSVQREPAILPDGPRAVISLRGVNRLKAGHVWIYRSDVISTRDAGLGTVVSVFDERGRFFGSALYSTSSQIAVRMLSDRPVADLAALIRERVGTYRREDALDWKQICRCTREDLLRLSHV